MQITYQKRDGCIFQRYRNTMIPYKIGDTTSMGWKVLNIEYEYNNKYYTQSEFNKLVHKDRERSLKKRQSFNIFIKEIKTFFYYFIAVIVISFLKTFLGI